jgi:hypothetical protein
MLLVERTDDERRARMALSQLALATARNGGHDSYAALFAAQLPEAQALVERLSKRRAGPSLHIRRGQWDTDQTIRSDETLGFRLSRGL